TNQAIVTKDNISYDPEVTITVVPKAEICGNGIDDDGDGITDCDCITTDNRAGGHLFLDLNQNGTWDSGESTTAGIKVFVMQDADQDGQWDASDPVLDTTLTDAAGRYEFALTGNTLSYRVGSSSDDAEEDLGDGSVNLTSTDLDMGMGYSSSSDFTLVGMRFQNLNIPQGATITEAYLEFKAKSSESGDCDLTFWAEKTDDAATFANSDFNLSNRPRTDTAVLWEGVPNFLNNQLYQTPNLSPIIQEIIDRPGWSPGNDLVILVEGTDKREVDSYNENHNTAPLLVVKYTTYPAHYLVAVDSLHLKSQTGGATLTTPPFHAFSFNDSDEFACTNDFGYVLDSVSLSSLCYAIAQDPNGQLFTWHPTLVNIAHIGTLGANQVETMTLNFDGSIIYAADADRLGTVDKNTGAFTPYPNTFGTADGALGTIDIDDVDGLAMDDETGLLYGTHRRGGSGNYDLLVKIHPLTGQIVENAFGPGVDYLVITGALVDIDDIAFNPLTNELFGVSTVSGSSTNDKVVKIDVQTGVATVVATLQTCDMEGFTFNDQGELFGTTGEAGCQPSADKNSLWKIDLANQTAIKLGSFEPDGEDVEACACLVSALPPPPEDGWQFGCDAGTCVEIVGMGIKNNVPATLSITDTAAVNQVIVEATYDGGSGAPTQVTFSSSAGETVTVGMQLFENSSSDRYFRAVMSPAASYTIEHPVGTNAQRAESFLLYVYRECEKTASFGAFVHKWLYQSSDTIGFTIPTTARPRDIEIAVPLSEITDDGRIAIVRATAGSVSDSIIVNTYNQGNSLNLTPFTLKDVPGSVDSITIIVESPPGGQSLFLSGAASASVFCNPDLEVVKSADVSCAAEGDVVNYTFKVFNNGTDTLNNLSLSDDVLGSISLSSSTLPPGDSLSATASYTVQSSDLPGPLKNIATVSGIAATTGDTLTHQDSVSVELVAVSLSKTADKTSASVGDTITYTYVVANDGSSPISYTLTDDVIGTITTDARVGDSLVVLYEFEEGAGSTVHDVSGVGNPLDLSIANPGNTSWISGGLSVNSATILSSGAAAIKVINAIKGSNEITVEVWVKNANTTQSGPARIFTLSENT
ncbi:MAG: hypothetical protein D6765_02425, partial [Bacteroidetes bacterium]